MEVLEERRKRLHGLIDLARASRGWSRAQLARALGRDPTKIYPDSGNPKADFLMRLAEILEWPVGEVIEEVWGSAGGDQEAEPQPAERLSYRALYEQTRASHQQGDFRRVVELSRRMHGVADSPELAGLACASEAIGWDGLGRYQQEIEAAQRGLRLHPVSVMTRNMLRAALANAWYSLWDLTPALGTAQVLVEWYRDNPPERRLDWKRIAFIHYVRGNTLRRMATVEPELADAHYEAAKGDLVYAAELYAQLSGELSDPALSGIANTCRGALVEVEVELGRRDPRAGIAELRDGIRRAEAEHPDLKGDWLESYGWWCTFAGDMALRHLEGRELHTAMSYLTSKTLEIADRLNNWAMRERAFTLQYTLHRTLSDSTGFQLDFTIDGEDRSLIAATMGRFPSFRPLGWEILRNAKIVASKEEALA